MPTITPAQRRVAKEHLLADLQRGCSVPEAYRRTPIPLHRTTIYRFRQRVHADPVAALADGRHGHPVKLRGEMLTFLIESCQATPSIASSEVQRSIQEHFGSAPSVSQLNRVRARLGLSRQPVPREKKASSSPLA